MTTNICLQCRVSEETKRQFAVVAQRHELSESAFLRRLVDLALNAAGPIGAEDRATKKRSRTARLMVRLMPDDRQLLDERSAARGMPAATYVSVLTRTHLRAVVPLPRAELQAIKRSIAELGAIGRLLNQIARVANQTGRASGPSRDELRALLQACQGLRTHIGALLEANTASWVSGYEAHR